MNCGREVESCEPMLTTREVAKWLRVTERHVQNLVKDGVLPPPLRLGRAVRFCPDSIRKFITEKTGEASMG